MRIGNWKFFEKTIVDYGSPQGPLLVRYILIRNPKYWGIFLHKLCRSDHDRALHDHPWPFVSLILANGYKEIHHVSWKESHNEMLDCKVEEITEEVLQHISGEIMYRPAEWRHRVVIEGKPCWTLVLVGPRARRWGFWPNGTWCWWRKYDTHKGICQENLLHESDDEA